MRLPLIKVPFVLPRSKIVKPSKPPVISAWRREASLPPSRRSQLLLRPMITVSRDRISSGGWGGQKSIDLLRRFILLGISAELGAGFT